MKGVEENKDRAVKITKEKANLEQQTSAGTENLMPEHLYLNIVRQIAEIRHLCDKKRAKGNNVPDATSQLVEIENHVNKILKFMQLAKIADAPQVGVFLNKLKNHFRAQKQEEILAQQKLVQEEQQRKLKERKYNRKFPTGVKRNIMRSKKPTL